VGDHFGDSVAVSGDGSTVVVGAPGVEVDNNTRQGAAYVFVRSASTWTQQAKLAASDGAALDQLGASTAVSADGNTAAFGLYNPATNAALYVFVRSGSIWTQQARLTGMDASVYSGFGDLAALSADGDTATFGGMDISGSGSSAYVFTRSGTSWSQQLRDPGDRELKGSGRELLRRVHGLYAVPVAAFVDPFDLPRASLARLEDQLSSP
jgi:hypothetical protein